MNTSLRRLRRGAAVLASAAALAGGAVTAVPTAAHAATNGMQLEFVDNIGDVYSICLTGTNQDGNPSSGCWSTPYTYNYVNDWWWEGFLEIDEYDANGNLLRTQYTNVPQVSVVFRWAFDDSTGNGYEN